MNKKFPVLSTVSNLLKIVGWLVVLYGAIYAAYEGIIEPVQPGHKFAGGDLFQLISGLGIAILGLVTVAFSEVIGVLFAIEENTRANKSMKEK